MIRPMGIKNNPSFLVFSLILPAMAGAAVEMGWELSQELSGIQLKTVKLENREGLKKAQDFKIKTIPTLVILKGEEECERLVGLPKKEKLEETLKRHLN